MAGKLALHVGISQHWLLANDWKSEPVCEHDPKRPFSKEIFELTRAEVQRPRTAPVDRFALSGYVEGFCSQLRGCASLAYETDSIIYFYYKVREFFNELERRWPGSSQRGLTAAEFQRMLESLSQSKKPAKARPKN